MITSDKQLFISSWCRFTRSVLLLPILYESSLLVPSHLLASLSTIDLLSFVSSPPDHLFPFDVSSTLLFSPYLHLHRGGKKVVMRAVPPHVVTFLCVILSSLFFPLTVLQPIDWWFCARSFVLIVLLLNPFIFDYCSPIIVLPYLLYSCYNTP